MRKISLILTVLLLTVPALAEVGIECSIDGTEVTVSYRVTEDEPNKVRAFALDISVSGANIVDVNDNINGYYTIYPGSIIIENGVVVDDGSAVADSGDLGSITGPNAATIEMGALYSPTNDDSPNAPPDQSDPNWYELLKFTCDGTPAAVSISENDTRGGVVMTDPTIDPDVNAPGCSREECLIGGNAGPSEYSDWVNFGKPDCWCYCRQCRGDADGARTGPYWVAIPDLNKLVDAYGKRTLPPGGICADFDHKQTGPYRVAIPDLNILVEYYGQRTVPDCSQAPVITGPYNFWCDPVNGCPGVCP